MTTDGRRWYTIVSVVVLVYAYYLSVGSPNSNTVDEEKVDPQSQFAISADVNIGGKSVSTSVENGVYSEYEERRGKAQDTPLKEELIDMVEEESIVLEEHATEEKFEDDDDKITTEKEWEHVRNWRETKWDEEDEAKTLDKDWGFVNEDTIEEEWEEDTEEEQTMDEDWGCVNEETIEEEWEEDTEEEETMDEDWGHVNEDTIEEDWEDDTEEERVFTLEYKGIQTYLNPRLFDDPQLLQNIAHSLQKGDVVIIRDAFHSEFAEAMHHDLDQSRAWELYKNYLVDGFQYHHHNIYKVKGFSSLMNSTYEVFNHPETKEFISQLSNRDCHGFPACSASYYEAGDHSLPHSDHIYKRSVAFIWHLSKNWLPEWGGALYWTTEHNAHSTIPASFNTLVLFSVTRDSSHFVTKVSQQAAEKRLTFNGWWQSSWVPSLDDDLEEMLASQEKRHGLTWDQYNNIYRMVHNEEVDVDPKRRESLKPLLEAIEREVLPQKRKPSAVHSVEF